MQRSKRARKDPNAPPNLALYVHAGFQLWLQENSTGNSRFTRFRFALFCLNPLNTKRISFIEGVSAYRAVNTLHRGYKTQSVDV
jgi:hypothetical protein